MIEEYKTHYSDKKYCELNGRQTIIDQMKSTGSIIVQCRHFHIIGGGCYVDFDPNNRRHIIYFKPRNCPLNSKLVNVIKD